MVLQFVTGLPKLKDLSILISMLILNGNKNHTKKNNWTEGAKVMLDLHLSELYAVDTRVLNKLYGGILTGSWWFYVSDNWRRIG